VHACVLTVVGARQSVHYLRNIYLVITSTIPCYRNLYVDQYRLFNRAPSTMYDLFIVLLFGLVLFNFIILLFTYNFTISYLSISCKSFSLSILLRKREATGAKLHNYKNFWNQSYKYARTQLYISLFFSIVRLSRISLLFWGPFYAQRDATWAQSTTTNGLHSSSYCSLMNP